MGKPLEQGWRGDLSLSVSTLPGSGDSRGMNAVGVWQNPWKSQHLGNCCPEGPSTDSLKQSYWTLPSSFHLFIHFSPAKCRSSTGVREEPMSEMEEE